MVFRWRAALMAAMVMGLGIGRAQGITDSTQALDIGQVIGANTFYANGYTGSRAIVADVEAGFVWNGQESLTQVTTYLAASTITGQFDRHATWVGSAIAGRGVGANPVFGQGIAYGATLWSGAIATSWNSAGPGAYSTGFNLSVSSFTTPFSQAMVTGQSGATADVVNVSWDEGSGGNTDGNDVIAQYVDSLIYQSNKLVVMSAGNDGPAGNTVTAPASGMNGLVVGALTSNLSAPVYGSAANFSSRSPTSFFEPTAADGSTGTEWVAGRSRVDITAPGTDLQLAFYGGATGGNSFGGFTLSGGNLYQGGLAGTSFAAPIVAGSAALVVDAGKALFPSDAHAVDGRVLKAVLMNSASRPAGWDNGQTASGGVISTSQALDNTYGAGILNMNNAYGQYTGGTTDVASLTGGTVKPVGWAFGQITHGAVTAHDDYAIDASLAAGTPLTVTLVWFADTTSDVDIPDEDISTFYGSFDNLDLQVWQTTGGVATTLVAESNSLFNAAEELSFNLPADGTYMVRVVEDNYIYNFTGDTSTDFGLAWSVGVPEPASLGLLACGGLVLLRRRGRR